MNFESCFNTLIFVGKLRHNLLGARCSRLNLSIKHNLNTWLYSSTKYKLYYFFFIRLGYGNL